MDSKYKMKKFEKIFVTDNMDPINKVLKKTLKSSKRIKLVCYDISKHYVLFGANNGSVHVYTRGPEAAFLKLIPCKNPAALEQISISPSEENISVIDETGLILILENCFVERNFYTHMYPECRGKTITAIKWDSDSRVYIGDNEGTVSILSVPNLVSLAILHTPYIALMDLGAPIIQIDTFSRFMLVTTKRKTFICDTEREMYKQVGRKEKSLGACFFNAIEEKLAESNDDFEKYRLYCARPGLRMWEANFEGEVFYTHSYRNAVPNINDILKFGEDENEDLGSENVNEAQCSNKNFGKMIIFNEKYLCVISNEALFIIDPEKNNLVFHKSYPYPIDVRLINNEIYIWNISTATLQVLNFYSFEGLLSRIWKYKQYKLGAQIVLRYKNDAIEWSKYSPDVKLLTELACKIAAVDQDLSQKFEEVLQEMLDYEKQQLQEFMREDDPKIGNQNANHTPLEPEKEEVCEDLQIMCKQYKLNESNPIVVIPQFTDMLIKKSGYDMTKIFLDFIQYLESSGEEIRMDWCYIHYMHHIHLSRNYLKMRHMNSETINFLIKSFLNVNKDYAPGCLCSFPFPNVNKTLPKYDIVGNELMAYSGKSKYLLHKVPHLWMHQIDKLRTIEDLEKNLALILQFGHMEVLKKVNKLVTYDFCDNLVDLFVRLKTGKCLNCGRCFPDENRKQLPNWDYMGLTLIPFIGADNVLKLFLSRWKDIPRVELSENFYVTCMFSKVRANSPENGAVPNDRLVKIATNFMDDNCTRTEFEDCLSTFLMGKVDKRYAQNLRKALTCSSCSYCRILLNHPVLNQIEKLDCGHAFHAICLRYIERVCNICFSNL